MADKNPWQYSGIPEERLRYLNSYIDFYVIIERIFSAMTDISFESEKFNGPELQNSKRPVFRFAISEKTVDLFFNSRWGYRGQYCLGPENGLEQNRRLINEISTKLLVASRQNPHQNMTEKLISRSLNFPSAKIWIDDDLLPIRGKPSLRIEIKHPTWVKNAKEAWEAFQDNNDHHLLDKTLGVRAPIGSHLNVKGGWFDLDGVEQVPSNKKNRKTQIRDFGFS